MQDTFILGLQTGIQDAAFRSTKDLYNLVGHNTGNLAFHYAINEQLGGCKESVSWYAPQGEINAKTGIAVLPCANQLGVHADYGSLADRFSQVDKKMVAIGLGAQASQDGDLPDIPEGTLRWVRGITEKAPTAAPNISVRGEFTLRALERYGLAQHAVVLGCPTLYINPNPLLGQAIAAKLNRFDRVAVAAGHQRWRSLSRLEQSLTRLVTATGGAYIAQSPMEMVQVARGEAALLPDADRKECRDYMCPELMDDEFISWTRRYGRAFFDIPGWLEYLRGFDVVIGARIHGVMLGLQAGVPGLCIAHDSRILELCETMCVPYVRAKDVQGGVSREQIGELIQFDPDAFDRNRQHLAARYVEFLRHNGIEPGSALVKIANALRGGVDQ